jgi:hypothetical protein
MSTVMADAVPRDTHVPREEQLRGHTASSQCSPESCACVNEF